MSEEMEEYLREFMTIAGISALDEELYEKELLTQETKDYVNEVLDGMQDRDMDKFPGIAEFLNNTVIAAIDRIAAIDKELVIDEVQADS